MTAITRSERAALLGLLATYRTAKAAIRTHLGSLTDEDETLADDLVEAGRRMSNLIDGIQSVINGPFRGVPSVVLHMCEGWDQESSVTLAALYHAVEGPTLSSANAVAAMIERDVSESWVGVA